MPPTSTAKLRYHGEGGALLGLMFVNALLTIITLGVYSFWARNKVRQFHYGNTEVDGDRLSWHGTGKELLIGALKAGVILFVLGIVYQFVIPMVVRSLLPKEFFEIAAAVTVLAVNIVFGILIAVAVNGARRYRLSRTSWRGVRFSFQGTWQDYVSLVVKGTLLSIVTLGFYSPYFDDARRAFLVNNTRFGSEPFMYKSDPSLLFKQFIKSALLSIPTLGLSWVWYAAFRHRHFWNHTTMRGGQFRTNVTAGDLIKLHFTNFLLVMFTLGIATPWVIVRTYAFWCENLSLYGTVDWASIQQRAQPTGATTAEGLADGLNLDVGLGM
jgi:uncharacterized membrane protein YjgN (DUF898 family)